MNPALDAILHTLALRQRNRQTTHLARFRSELRHEGFKFTNTDYQAAWESLALTGAGSIQWGKRGALVSFTWKKPLKDVAKRALVEPAKQEQVVRPLVVKMEVSEKMYHLLEALAKAV